MCSSHRCSSAGVPGRAPSRREDEGPGDEAAGAALARSPLSEGLPYRAGAVPRTGPFPSDRAGRGLAGQWLRLSSGRGWKGGAAGRAGRGGGQCKMEI